MLHTAAASNPGMNRGTSVDNDNNRILRGSEGHLPRSDEVFNNQRIISYPVIKILLNTHLYLQDSINSIDKVTPADEKESSSEDEGISCLAYRLLVQILPHEENCDIAKRKMLLFSGLLDLIEVLAFADESLSCVFSYKARQRDIRSLVDTIMGDPPPKDVTARRSEVRRKVEDILERHAKIGQATYMSQVRPLLQDLMNIVISAEQTSSKMKRNALRETARSTIENILKLTENEYEEETREFHDTVNYILEELYSTHKHANAMKSRKHVQGGLRELISQVCATRDPEAVCIEGRHNRTCNIRGKELNMNVKKFMEMAVPDVEVEDTCELRHDCQVAIRDLLDYCIPIDESDKSLRSVLRNQVHKILAMLCRGYQHVEGPRRELIRESVKDHLISIITLIKIETQRKFEEDREVNNILNKIIPEGETKNIYQQRNCARRGIEELVDKITPTTGQIDALPSKFVSIPRRSTLASLKVPQLVDQLFPHDPSKVWVNEGRTALSISDDLVEMVLPISEANQDEEISKLRSDVLDLLAMLQSLGGGQLERDPQGKSEFRSMAQQRLRSIIRRTLEEEDRKSRIFEKYIQDVLYSILSAGEIEDVVKQKNILCLGVYQLFDSAVPSVVSNHGKIMPESMFARSTSRAIGSIFPRRSTLHSDIRCFVETIAENGKKEYSEVQSSLQCLLENVVPIGEAEQDVLFNAFRQQAEKLMKILMSFEKCKHDPVKKEKMCAHAYVQVTRMLKTVEEIRSRSNDQWQLEIEDIIDKLLTDIDNTSTFGRKCTLRRGMEDLLLKVFCDKSVESVMLRRPEQRESYAQRKIILSEVLQMFVDGVIPETEDEFTIQRHTRLRHLLQDIVDIVIPSVVCKEFSAYNCFCSNLKVLLETIIVVHDIGDDGARKEARHLLRYRLENVLRDAEIMEIQRREKLLKEIDNFTNKLFLDGQTEKTFEKKRRIAQGIEELLVKLLLSGENENLMPLITDTHLTVVHHEIKNFVDCVILDGQKWPQQYRNDINQVKRNLVDTVIPSSEAKNNIILTEIQGDIERVLDSVADMEQEENPIERELIRSAAREHIGNAVTGVDFEKERKNLQIYVNTENILDKIIPAKNMSDKDKRILTLHRGIEELSEKAAPNNQGDIMMLRRSTLPSVRIMTRTIKKIVVRVMPDERLEDSSNRQSEIHSSVKDFLDKTIPPSECEDNSHLHEMRKGIHELLGSVVPAALSISDPQRRIELREVGRGLLESIFRNSDVEAQKRRTLLHEAAQSILVNLLPGDEVGSELGKMMMLADGIEDMFSKIIFTVNVDRRSCLVDNGVEKTVLREEVEQLAEQLLDGESAIESSCRESRLHSSVDYLLHKVLAPTPRTPALEYLHNETMNLLTNVVPSWFAERNPSRRSNLQEKALELLQAIVYASETHHKLILEKVDEEAEEILNKIIPATNDGPISILQEGIQEVVEKVVPLADDEESMKLSEKVQKFVKKVSQPPDPQDQPRKKSADESRNDVHEFMAGVFLAEEAIEFGESMDDLQELLLMAAEAQSLLDEGERTILRDKAQPILEKIITKSLTGKEIKFLKMATAVRTIFVALDQPRPAIPVASLEQPVSCDQKRKGLFGSLFPWKGKMFLRREKTRNKVEIARKLSKTRKKASDKRKRK